MVNGFLQVTPKQQQTVHKTHETAEIKRREKTRIYDIKPKLNQFKLAGKNPAM